MRFMVVIALAGYMHCVLPSALAQATAPATSTANAMPEVHIRALAEHERREAMTAIQQKLRFELAEDVSRRQAMKECANSFQMTRQLLDDVKQLEGLVLLQLRSQKILQEVSAANSRQIELITLIESAMLAGNLLPQVADYLQEAKKQVSELGMRQINQKKQLDAFRNSIDRAIKSVPAPASFVSLSGIVMRRYGQGRHAIYISEKPISQAQYQAIVHGKTDGAETAQTELSAPEAMAFCQLLSAREQQAYLLPDLNQLKVLSLTGYNSPCALWINSAWLPDDLDNDRALERFAMAYKMVWDPQKLFASGVTFGELPFARHPQLGFCVVTAIQNGWNMRWQRLLNSLNTEEAIPPPTTPALPQP